MSTKAAVLGATVLALAALGASLALYPSLPDKIPTHWNIQGEVDGWSSRPTGAFLVPIIMAVAIMAMVILPWLSPRNFKVDSFRGTFNYVMVAVVALLGYVHSITLLSALNPEQGTNLGRHLVGGICLFLAVIGKTLGKVRRNFWMGVRTPWTLASDEVWIATHRLAARLMTAGGVLGAVLTWAGVSVVAVFAVIMVSALCPAVYSLILYKRLESRENGNGSGGDQSK